MPQGTQGTPQGSQRRPVYLQGAPQGPKFGTKFRIVQKYTKCTWYLRHLRVPNGTRDTPQGTPLVYTRYQQDSGTKLFLSQIWKNILVPNSEHTAKTLRRTALQEAL